MSDAKPTADDLAAWTAATAPRPRTLFGACTCGRGIEDHGRIKPSGSPEYEYRCPLTPTGVYTAQDGSRWPHGPAGAAA